MIFWSVFVIIAVIGVALHMLFFYRLRRDCHHEWVRLGSPNPFLVNDAKLAFEIAKYVLTGSFEGLPDGRLVKLGRLLRYYEWFYVMGFFALVLLFFYSLIR